MKILLNDPGFGKENTTTGSKGKGIQLSQNTTAPVISSFCIRKTTRPKCFITVPAKKVFKKSVPSKNKITLCR